MTVTSLRFDDEIYKELKELANFHGMTITAFMKETLLERLQDELDVREAEANLRASKGKTVSREEVMRQAGMLD